MTHIIIIIIIIINVFYSKPVPLLGVLGKARYHFNNYQYIQAIEVINSALIPMGTCIPLYIEKMKIELALNEWDVVIETAKRSFIIFLFIYLFNLYYYYYYYYYYIIIIIILLLLLYYYYYYYIIIIIIILDAYPLILIALKPLK